MALRHRTKPVWYSPTSTVTALSANLALNAAVVFAHQKLNPSFMGSVCFSFWTKKSVIECMKVGQFYF